MDKNKIIEIICKEYAEVVQALKEAEMLITLINGV